jgi:hypothetical protein
MNDNFDKEQLAWTRYLASLPADQKCDCGRALHGRCYGHCYGDAEKGGASRSPREEK